MHHARPLAGAALAALLLFSLAEPLFAQSAYPSRPIRKLLPYAAGGTLDTMARAMAADLSARVGQPVLVENRPGATGLVGAAYVAKSPGDGYLVMMTSAAIVAQAASMQDLPFDFERELKPVLIPFSFPFFIFAHPGFPAGTLEELIAYAKTGKGLSYGTSGGGSAIHLAFELFNQQTRGNFVHVPYKGGAESTAAVLKGEVNIVGAAPVPGLAMWKQGRLKLLGVLGTKRSRTVPAVPALSEAGIESFDARSWLGYFVPGTTPPGIVNALNAELIKSSQNRPIREQAQSLALEVDDPQSPEQVARGILQETRTWVDLFKRTGVKPSNS